MTDKNQYTTAEPNIIYEISYPQ